MKKLSVIVVTVHLLSVSAFGQTVGDSIKNRIFENLAGEIKTVGEFGVLVHKLKISPEELYGFPVLFPIRIDTSGDTRITSGYGWRMHPLKNIISIHNGIDIAASRGTPVYCAGDGTVRRAQYEPGYGWFVEIEHRGGFSTLYGHLDKVWVNPGDWTGIGSHIGSVGSSGISTGDHLHFEVRKNDVFIDPLIWYKSVMEFLKNAED